MGFSSFKGMVEAQVDLGRAQYSTFYKRPANVNDARAWLDLSMSPGNPRPNFYASNPYESALPNGRHGLYHGGDVAPKTKHLVRLAICGTDVDLAGSTFLLCDYLLYYPFLDMDSTDEQVLANVVSLPRYTDGRGVYAILVATAVFIGGARFSINYTNQEGVPERNSLWVMSATPTNPISSMLVNTTAASGRLGPFLPLTTGDTGIRSVQSITFESPNGGLASLVLVKPLATLIFREASAWVDRDYRMSLPSMPRIHDGAYLNFLCLPAGGSIAGSPIIGEAEFTWG